MSSLSFTYSNSFSNVSVTDLVIRTAQNTQNLVIGTGFGSYCNACMYISDNGLGIQKVPDPGLVVDCLNSFNVDSANNVNILQNLNALWVTASNLTVDQGGILFSSNSMLSNLLVSSVNSITDTMNLGNNQTSVINIGQYGGGPQSINIGGFPATVSIGNYADMVNVSGVSLTVSSSNTYFANQAINLNSMGGVGSADGAGFSIVEAGMTTGYIKTSSDRNSFLFETPAGVSPLTMNLASNSANFTVNYYPQLTLCSNSFVGVNTSFPTSQLTVNGDIATNANVVGQNVNTQTLNVGQSGFVQSLSCSNLAISAVSCSFVNASNITMGLQDLRSKIVLQPNHNNSDTQNCSVGYSNSAVIFQADQPSTPFIFGQGTGQYTSSELMRLTSTGLGIGTTNPIQALDINGNALVRNSLFTSYIQSSSSLTLEPASPTDNVFISCTNSNGSVTLLGNHVFNSQRVGINNTNPQYPLDVSGRVNAGQLSISGNDGNLSLTSLSQSLGFGDASIIGEHLSYNSNSQTFQVVSDGNNAGFSGMMLAQNGLKFYTGFFAGQRTNYNLNPTQLGLLEQMSISTNGVGIGVDMPLSQLHVNGTGKNVFATLSGQSNFSQGVIIQDQNLTWQLYKPSNTSDLRVSNGSLDLMTFNNSGSVGIGTTIANADFHVYDGASGQNVFRAENPNGSVMFTSGGQLKCYSASGFNYFLAGTNVSDERLKDNIEEIENPLDIISNLEGVYYNYKNELKMGEHRRVGLIAQQVREHLPEVVQHDEETGHLSVEYDKIIPVLIESNKELHRIIKRQQEDIDEIKLLLNKLGH